MKEKDYLDCGKSQLPTICFALSYTPVPPDPVKPDVAGIGPNIYIEKNSIMIIWKGKGILIFLYFMATAIVMGIIAGILKENFESVNSAPFEAFMGSILIVTGIWTKMTAEDYYFDKEGRKKYLDIENSLFFIKMSTWGLILPSVGVGLIIYGVMKAF